jgi:hypothetical protein
VGIFDFFKVKGKSQENKGFDYVSNNLSWQIKSYQFYDSIDSKDFNEDYFYEIYAMKYNEDEKCFIPKNINNPDALVFNYKGEVYDLAGVESLVKTYTNSNFINNFKPMSEEISHIFKKGNYNFEMERKFEKVTYALDYIGTVGTIEYWKNQK